MRLAVFVLVGLAVASVVQADSFGVGSAMPYAMSIDDCIGGTQDSPGSDGTLDSVRVYLKVETATHNVHCAVYMISNSGDTVWVDSTEVRSLAVGGPAWYWFDFIENANIYSDSTYYIVCQADNSNGDAYMYMNLTGAPWWYSVDNYAAWPSTITGSLLYDRDISIEAYYTVEGPPNYVRSVGGVGVRRAVSGNSYRRAP